MKYSSKYILFCLVLILAFLGSVFTLGFRHQPFQPVKITVVQQEILIEEEEENVIELIPYEQCLRAEAERIGWDWHLLAAVCYEESHFDPMAQSRQGAKGLMQLMPQTAAIFGLNDTAVFCPEANIHAGADYIAYLQDMYSFITDSASNIHFVLASYNAGPAHIMDARRLAKKYGSNAYRWYGETEKWLQALAQEEFYTDSVVLYGQFNATETTSYVSKVLRRTKEFQQFDIQ